MMYKFRLLIKVLLENQPCVRLKLLGETQFNNHHLNLIFLETPLNKFIQDSIKHSSTHLGFAV